MGQVGARNARTKGVSRGEWKALRVQAAKLRWWKREKQGEWGDGRGQRQASRRERKVGIQNKAWGNVSPRRVQKRKREQIRSYEGQACIGDGDVSSWGAFEGMAASMKCATAGRKAATYAYIQREKEGRDGWM